MTSNPNNLSLEICEMISGLEAYHQGEIAHHQEGLKRVGEMEQKFNAYLSNPAVFKVEPKTTNQNFVAFANGKGLTQKAFSKIKENDFDVILNMRNNRLRFRQDPAQKSDLIDSKLENIGRRRIAFLAYMIKNPAVYISVDNVPQFYDPLAEIEPNTVSKTIQKLRRALGSSKQTYIVTEKPWENDYCSYKLNPKWRYLLIKYFFKSHSKNIHRSQRSHGWPIYSIPDMRQKEN